MSEINVEAARRAREAAADLYGQRGKSYARDVFAEGWDAAIAWVIRQNERGQEEVGYPDFKHGEMPLG